MSLESSSVSQIYLCTRMISLAHYPKSFIALFDFSGIDVLENGVTSMFLPDMCKRGQLVFFISLHNLFTGEIPKSYGECSILNLFQVRNNNLISRVPYDI